MSERWDHRYGLGEHAQAPANPSAGVIFACSCGISYEYVVLDDGYAEWVQVTDPT